MKLTLTSICILIITFMSTGVFSDGKPKLGGSREIIKAWVNFDGADCISGVTGDECTIRDSYNVERVVRDASTFFYTIYWQKPFKDCGLPDACYVVIATANDVHTRIDRPYTTESVVVRTLDANNALSICGICNVMAIGTLD